MNAPAKFEITGTSDVSDVQIDAGTARLVGKIHRPDGTPRAAVVLNGATGVPQGYYQGFAQWLAETQNLACLTYDYRDFGLSATGPIRQSKATMVDWGVHDQQAALKVLGDTFPDTPLWVVGHSIGGLMLPFQDGADRVERMITVASGPVHIKDHPWDYVPSVLAFWYGAGPIATKVLGYLPGKILGLGADIPSGVYWQWRRWCTTPGFNRNDIGRALPHPNPPAMRGEMKVVSVSDDAMVPPSAVWRLMGLYPEAKKRQLTLRPDAFGLKKIGHIGAFARRNAAVWPAIIA
ncbi:alpha/beta hydrolase family protein [Actibacterium lipolyticum]|uniref:Alpha/beta hydrolase family protein n=1 Tax=Actibacterium lipolyticum TaxID=1524263 RepID=A0A238KQY8_9RHOB|nr:alpha/beta fold hydrolase [Actibacterium lipolyticum]SMX45138.1 Alpha/beta hydrolase family protein [Actibacterium lipolyticum]